MFWQNGELLLQRESKVARHLTQQGPAVKAEFHNAKTFMKNKFNEFLFGSSESEKGKFNGLMWLAVLSAMMLILQVRSL